MPVDIRVITPRDFVRVSPSGEVDQVETRNLLKGLFKACADGRISHILLDARGLHGETSFQNMWELATDLKDLGMNPIYKLAILHKPRGVYAEFLAQTAKEAGWQVAAHDSFEEAFLWLNNHHQ